MPEILHELRYALRGFRKSPLLAAAAIFSLALGIGANTAIFTLTDQLLLRSLPVHQPDRLVLLSAPGPKRGFVESNYDDGYAFSYPLYCDLRDRAPGLAGVLARFPMRMSLSWGEETQLIEGDLVSGNYFDVLGVRTVLGRALMPADDRLGNPKDRVVIQGMALRLLAAAASRTGSRYRFIRYETSPFGPTVWTDAPSAMNSTTAYASSFRASSMRTIVTPGRVPASSRCRLAPSARK